MRERRGLDDARLLAAGPGRLCQALGVTGEHDGLPLDRAAVRAPRRATGEPEIVAAPRIGITRAAELPGATCWPARGSSAGPCPERDRQAGAAASPALGCCRTTVRAEPAHDRAGASAARASPAPARRGSPTTLGITPCSGLAKTIVTLSNDDSRPFERELLDDDAERLSGRRPACRRRPASAAAPRAGPARRRRSSPTTFGTSTSFGLQFAVFAGERPSKYATWIVFRQSPLSSWKVPSRRTSRAVRRRRGCSATGSSAGSSFRYGSAFSMNALPDQRRERAAGDRVAVELRQHRHELVRVADPDRDDELRRVADEPGVAVVLRRPGLAGDRAAVRQLRPLARCPTGRPAGGSTLTISAFVSADHLRVACGRVLLAVHGDDHPRAVPDDRPVDALAAVRERRVRARHLERVDRLAAEPDREVALQRARDPEPVGGRRRPPSAGRAASAARRRCCRSRSSPSSGRSARGSSPRSCGRSSRGRRAEIDTGFDSNRVDGEIPCSSAVASTNGLNDEPGWRSPWTARLNWLFAVVVAADHREHAAVARIDRDERRRRPVRAGQHLRDRRAAPAPGARGRSSSRTLSPPPKTLPEP